MVREDESTKDTTAWDAPGVLPWLVPFPVGGSAERKREEPAPDHALRDTAPWEPEDSGFATWRRANLAEGERIEPEASPVRCGGPNYTREQLAAMRAEREAEAKAETEAEEEEEDKERTSSDLLVRDTSAWGGRTSAPPPGVLG